MDDLCQKENLSERGNALIYVLIAIALFAALTMTLGRQTDSGETNSLSGERAQIYATQLISYTAQAKAAIENMEFSNVIYDDLDFSLPGTAGFTGGVEDYKKVYHPQGGGLIPSPLPTEAIEQDHANPPPSWYLGRFNNVEWSESIVQDIILVAYQIDADLCAQINQTIIGDPTIPAVTADLADIFIDNATNADFDIADCAGCNGQLSMCVSDSPPTFYAFYTVLFSL